MTIIDDGVDALEKNTIDLPTRNEVLGVPWSVCREAMRVRPANRHDGQIHEAASPRKETLHP